MKYRYIFLVLLALLVLCATAVYAQEEYEYVGSFNLFSQVVSSIIWSAIYIAIYAGALIVPLAYLRLFNGYENEQLLWIGLLWAGGMVINALVYHITHIHFLAAILAIPLIFAWAVLINTRSFADLIMRDAVRVAAVVAVLCAPWFGPTWNVQRPKPAPVESYQPAPHMTTPCLASRLEPVVES